MVASAAPLASVIRMMLPPRAATSCMFETVFSNTRSYGAITTTGTLTTTSADMIGTDAGWAAVLVGDAFYEKSLAERLLPWLRTLARRGAAVLIGDPGRSYFPKGGLTLCASYEVPVTRALEDSEHKRTSVWRLEG